MTVESIPPLNKTATFALCRDMLLYIVYVGHEEIVKLTLPEVCRVHEMLHFSQDVRSVHQLIGVDAMVHCSSNLRVANRQEEVGC